MSTSPVLGTRPGFLTPTPVHQRSIAKLREAYPWSSIKKADEARIFDESDLPTTPVTRKAPVNRYVESPPTLDELRRYLQNFEELPISYTAEEFAEIEGWYHSFMEKVQTGQFVVLIRNVEKKIAQVREHLAKN